MSMGARYQCSVCDGYLEGGSPRSRCTCEEVLAEARVFVEKYGQQNAETGTALQARVVALLDKIDAALAQPTSETGE